jgi:hypothetical protein
LLSNSLIMMRHFVPILALAAGCATDDRSPPGRGSDDPPPDEISPTAAYLSPAQHLTRISLALRGMRPAIDDLRAVESDPTKLGSIVDRYLDSPAFGETIMEMHNETLLLRIEQPQFTFPNLGALAGATARQMNGRFEEPLRLIQDIVMSDQPYTKIVTADYTMADATSATIWGLPHTGPAAAWEKTAFTDGRPAVGILATSAFYDRWRSTGANYNRGRANEISRALLCHDYLHADILIDTSVDLSDPEVVSNAVVANPSCAGCHQTLDPLASHLFTFKRQITPVSVDFYPQTIYSPATVNQWRGTNKRPPMYFGAETGTLTALGDAIAADPRFARCAATRFASYFTEVAQDEVSLAWIARLQQAFVDSNYSAKALAKTIVLSDEFRISHDTDAVAAELTVGTLKLRPEQLHRMLRDLTGFGWSVNSTTNLRGMPYGQANLLESDYIGFRVLAGGIDGYFVTQPVHTMNATSSLVAKSAASSAADFVVDHDLAAAAAERTLFVEAAVNATDPDRIRAQLAYLHARIYGELVAPDSPEVDETFTLYTDAFAETGNRARAWKLTLVGMLSDFRSLFY